jgi:hypothetical protein
MITKVVYTSEAKVGLPRFRRIIFYGEISKHLGTRGLSGYRARRRVQIAEDLSLWQACL